MGFSPLFIKLIQGLVLGGSSVIHDNGMFSRDVDLGRGVRQGCPLAAFLYTRTTQSLMAIFKQRAEQGLLSGIPLTGNGNKQLLY